MIDDNIIADGASYELFAYEWLTLKGIEFEKQIKAPGKNNILDGCFTVYGKQVFFDVKTFEIPYSCLTALSERLSERFENYQVVVLGGYTASYKSLQRIIEKSLNSIIENLINNFNADKSFSSCDVSIPQYGNLKIKLYKKDKMRGFSYACSIDPYSWAEQNERFFLDKSKKKQFTDNEPFVIICPYSEKFTFKDIDIRFRSIARRTFIKYKEESELLSAILFINTSDMNARFYANPNAKNKIDRLFLNKIFLHPTNGWPFEYDDFQFDNY